MSIATVATSKNNYCNTMRYLLQHSDPQQPACPLSAEREEMPPHLRRLPPAGVGEGQGLARILPGSGRGPLDPRALGAPAGLRTPEWGGGAPPG
uniref:Uncharacterized protein n=1 Tax=Setaria italica TaxID=4555 RepID=K3YNW6_SETIT